jgi:pilus assembly protein Flp/PilA
MNGVSRFLQDESATTAVEYAVMLALILLACIGAITTFGTGQGSKWSDIDRKLDAVGF